jgi:iron complex outermembrane recepter protein
MSTKNYFWSIIKKQKKGIMKKITKLLFTALVFTTISGFAQKKIHGYINDKNGPLTGVKIAIDGSEKVITTDFDGSFTLDTNLSSGSIDLNFLGYNKLIVEFSVTKEQTKIDFGTIIMQSGKNIVIQGVTNDTKKANFKIDRKKLVASSNGIVSDETDKSEAEDFFRN